MSLGGLFNLYWLVPTSMNLDKLLRVDNEERGYFCWARANTLGLGSDIEGFAGLMPTSLIRMSN